MKWNKIAHIFDPTKQFDIPWMKEYSQCVSTLMIGDNIRVYFSCRPGRDKDGQHVSYTGFADFDKNFNMINISKEPVLPLGGLGAFDEFAVYPTCILEKNNDVLLYYAGWNRCKSVPYNTSIGLAISKDGGTSFERYGKGPILTRSVDEPFELSGPKVRKIGDLYFMYYLAGEGWQMYDGRAESVYKIRLALSEDGIHWNKLNRDIIPSILDDECQAGPDVFYKDGKYHMYFSYRYGLDYRNNKERNYRIGYAYSYDAITWERDDENVGIELSKEGWDSECMHYPHVFGLDGEWYMLYNGNEFGRYGFGLAKLEKQ